MKAFCTSLLIIGVAFAGPNTARSCDLCGCYTPQLEVLQQNEPGAGLGSTAPASSAGRTWMRGLYGGVAEQFTHFGTLQFEGREVVNVADQHLESSITQLVAGYSINSRFGVQVNVPFIYRSFERPEGFEIDRGTEAGLGDVSLLGKLVLFRKETGGRREVVFDDKSPRLVAHEPDFTASAVLLAGIKLPTGDSSRIREEFSETEVEGAPESGIHGHDLTLGTGSYDGIVAGQTSLRYRSVFFQADTQFVLRGDGRHQYHFANDLSWSGGPGYYVVRTKDKVLGIQAVVSGEDKDVDRFRGERAEDTGIRSVFLGPRVIGSVGRVSAEAAVEFPVSIENTALQVVPDYRLRGGVAISF